MRIGGSSGPHAGPLLAAVLPVLPVLQDKPGPGCPTESVSPRQVRLRLKQELRQEQLRTDERRGRVRRTGYLTAPTAHAHVASIETNKGAIMYEVQKYGVTLPMRDEDMTPDARARSLLEGLAGIGVTIADLEGIDEYARSGRFESRPIVDQQDAYGRAVRYTEARIKR